MELSVDASPYGLGVDIMHVYSNGNRRPIAYASQTLNEHDKAFSYGIRFVPSKRNAVADALSRLPLPSAFNEEDATYRVEERLVHSLPITHKEIRYATQVDPVLSIALEFFKKGCPQYVEDFRLQPFFNRQIELSVEQGLRVINPTRFKEEWLEELHTGHPGFFADKGNGSYLLLVAEH